MSYTSTDTANANKFAEANVRIRMLRRMMKTSPHVVSHLKVTVRPATNEDYAILAPLAHCSFVVDIALSETACKQLTCNPITEQSVCDPRQKASYYRVGDDAFDLQCQPACFNLARKQQYNDDGTRMPDTPMLNWSEGACRLQNSQMISVEEKPWYRSSTHFVTRLNDFPIGFSRVPVPRLSGFTYRMNAAYCGFFDRVYDERARTCETTTLDFLVDSVIGSQLWNTVKSAITVSVNGQHPFDPPSGLPSFPERLPETATLDGWRAHVDETFRVPDEIEVRPRFAKTRTARDLDSSTRAAAANLDARSVTEETMSEFLRHVARLSDGGGDGETRKTRSRRAATRYEATSPSEDWQQTIYRLFDALFEDLGKAETWEKLGVAVTTDAILLKVRSLATKLSQKMLTKLSADLGGVGARIGSRVLLNGLRAMSTRLIGNFVIRIAARATIMLAKLVAAAASVVGWLLAVVFVLDFVFQFWDPFGYNNLFPAEVPNDMMTNGEYMYRKALQSSNTDYTWDHLTNLLLSDEEVIEIRLESMLDTLVYLDTIEINSEGSRIDKGRELELRDRGPYVDQLQRRAAAQKFRFSAAAFERYNRRFDRRAQLVNELQTVATYTGCLGLTLALLRVSDFLSFLVNLLALLVYAMARYSMYNDRLLDLYEENYERIHA